jgi:hypothetical protein
VSDTKETYDYKGPGINGEPSLTECVVCGAPLPLEGEEGYHPMRTKCDDHRRKRDTKKQSVPKPLREAKVTPEPVADELAPLVAGASFYLAFLPMLLSLIDHDSCPDAIEAAIPGIALQLAKLCEYHPGLATFLTPADSVGEGMVWAGLGMAAWPVLAVVLVNHNLLPKELAEKLAVKMLEED